ncbi:peroxiredoxin [Salinihabitans flavidus]|nr:peroxiredoxin [Salinihabitans flavidus]
MAISTGDRMPDATLSRFGAEGPEQVPLVPRLDGRKVVVFGLPGAFSRGCSKTHLPSFMRTADAFREKGVEEIICVSVNDPFVMAAWDETTGAGKAGVTLLADPASELTKALGMNMDVPPIGFYDRSQRYAMLVEDGVVKVLQTEETAGACELTTGEALLEAI